MDFEYYVKYFAMLENRLLNTEQYVAYTEDNLDCYSMEYVSLINDCCSLINGFCYDLCKIEKPNRKEFRIADYKTYIKQHFSYDGIVLFGCYFKIQPWEKLKEEDVKKSTPLWWKSYNSVKHSGKSNFKQATLRNAISCMAGMFDLLRMYDYKLLGTTICNWRGIFCAGGNVRQNISWDC